MSDKQRSAPKRGSSPVYSADRVRGGEIILKTFAQKLVFIGGLVGAVLLGWVLVIVALWT